jgi:uncharacterized small protein (DUF1192 family)
LDEERISKLVKEINRLNKKQWNKK